ncbi:Sodium channel protein Nach [Harpegnathos saltator]|uniref:Sodium channel protein Nach n=1 Tax=Harpegnathos saltator TaxID=610380 RepID=E2B395_HARSA|nr:Sodium channel protein Nach [Harpegnathos saltator]
MTILINGEPNDYHASIIGSFGVKVMIHYSFDYPDFNAEIQLIQLNSQYFVSVNPSEMYSKPEVRNLAISTRKCIFNDEADELLFRDGTRICNLRDIHCLQEYQTLFDTSWPGINLTAQKNLPRTISDVGRRPCGCIPDCSLYHYPIEYSFGKLDPSVYYKNGGFSKNPHNTTSLRNHSMLHVFFNDLVGFQYRRSVNYSWRNLFASFGGLLGLFAGFSLMSIFEFLYFFVIRVITDAYFNNSTKHNNAR